jgi:hypothetical protein
MDVKDIVLKYLKEKGFGGLHYDECSCLDNNLMPCGEACDQCIPAYKIPVHCDTCEAACDSRGDKGIKWCLTSEKPIEYKIKPCPKCKSNNIKCLGLIFNCEDCGARW